jgi:hypothetical protein
MSGGTFILQVKTRHNKVDPAMAVFKSASRAITRKTFHSSKFSAPPRLGGQNSPISSPRTPGTLPLLDNPCFLWETPPDMGAARTSRPEKENVENWPINGARLYPKDQPQRIGLSCRVASVPRRRSFGHIAATGLGGTVALRPSGAGARLRGVGGSRRFENAGLPFQPIPLRQRAWTTDKIQTNSG